MYNYINKKSGKVVPLIADDVYEIIMKVIPSFQQFFPLLSIDIFYWPNYL